MTLPHPNTGNKYALGNKGGAPRTVSFSEDEMIALGEEMVNWVLENDPIHLSMWYSINKNFTDKQWDTFQQRREFVPYYEKALKLVGFNYLSKSSDVEPSLKQRWQRVYFKDIKHQEDEDLKFKVREEIKAKQEFAVASQVSPNQNTLDKDDLILRQQAEISELKQKISNAV